MTRKVLVTGVGIIAPGAADSELFWERCKTDTHTVAPVPGQWHQYASLSSTAWAPLPEIQYNNSEVSRIDRKQMDPVSLNGIHTAFRAVENAGLSVDVKSEKHRTWTISGIDPNRAGVFIGTGVGGIHTIGTSYAHQICRAQATQIDTLAAAMGAVADDLNSLTRHLHFPKRFNPFTVSMLMPNACAANIAIKLGITGPNRTINLACASGTAAIGQGYRAILENELDFAIAGGSEYLFDAYGTIFRAFDEVRTLAHGELPFERLNRPFDEQRSGFLFSQGGSAILVMESEANALSRGASPVAEVAGFAESCDAHSIMMIEKSGAQIARMLEDLTTKANVSIKDVDYINAHGTGTQLNDQVEVEVIKRLFKDDVAVNSTKALIGHPMGAAGAIEAAVSAFSIRDQFLHGMPNLEHPIAPINFITKARKQSVKTAISQSFGFGGHNTALFMRRYC